MAGVYMVPHQYFHQKTRLPFKGGRVFWWITTIF